MKRMTVKRADAHLELSPTECPSCGTRVFHTHVWSGSFWHWVSETHSCDGEVQKYSHRSYREEDWDGGKR